MIVTTLDAQVAPENEHALLTAYGDAATGPFPAGFVRSTLMRAAGDPTRWRIETVWQSREALEAMRTTGTPRGVMIFRAAGAEPEFELLEVVRTLAPDGRS